MTPNMTRLLQVAGAIALLYTGAYVNKYAQEVNVRSGKLFMLDKEAYQCYLIYKE